MASSFAKLARTAENTGRLQVSKEPVDSPPYDIHTLGDQVLRAPAKRIGKVDDSIRSLARDLGDVLGCGGALATLRRTEALGFGLEQAVPLEALDQAPCPPLLDPLTALAHLPRRQLDAGELESWRCGRALGHALPLQAGEPVAVLGPDGNLAGMARAQDTALLQPKLVFNAAG